MHWNLSLPVSLEQAEACSRAAGLSGSTDAWQQIPGALKKSLRPILGIFGAEEGGITPTDVRKFGAALDPLGKKIEIKICADAGPAFENPNRERYRAQPMRRMPGSARVDFPETTLKRRNGHDRASFTARPSGQKPCRGGALFRARLIPWTACKK